MKVPFYFPSSTDTDILVKTSMVTEEEHEQQRSDSAGLSITDLDTGNQPSDLASSPGTKRALLLS